MAQRYSQNGWPAYPNTDNFVRQQVVGQGWWFANTDVARVFREFIERFDAEVEKIAGKVLDDWSYANRLVRGSPNVVSNHGSATAIDLNALQHPLGVEGTFTGAQEAKMRQIKNAITDNSGKPVLRLGLDYLGRKDEMHIEINADAAEVKQAANKLRARDRELENTAVAVTKQELRDMLIDLIKEEPIVRNKPLDPGVKEGGRWTLEGVLAAADQKTDLQGRTLATLVEAQKATNAKLDQLIALLTPKTGAPKAP